MREMIPLGLLVASILAPVLAALQSPNLNIVNANISPDGFNRSAVLAGGVFPGPVISANKGDSLQINVVNELTDVRMLKSTSIHWHGIFQSGTPWADGPAFVTQCPIATGESFLYSFAVGSQAGTFWYHSHLSTQYCDGLRGPLIIYDPNDPHAVLYDVDDASTIITLADWYHVVSTAMHGVPTPDATLINGLGRYKGGPASPLAVIQVQQGKRYRIRLISTSCDPNYHFSIDDHELQIIEVDGVNTRPLFVDSIQIFAGQRYSFVLNANQLVSNYWIRANPSTGTPGYLGGLNCAILRYSGAPLSDPISLGGISLNPMLETNLVPLENPGAPGAASISGADVDIHLNLGFNLNSKFTVNGVSFEPPTVPVLLQILSGARAAASLLPSGSVYTLPPNKVIQLSFSPGMAPGGPHPFHLHGHTFDVIRSAGSGTYNYVNPVRRDVVSTGTILSLDNVTIRFTTDNSGPWLLHCHIDWHLEAGLAIVMAEDPAGTANITAPPPSAWENLCPTYNALNASQRGGQV